MMEIYMKFVWNFKFQFMVCDISDLQHLSYILKNNEENMCCFIDKKLMSVIFQQPILEH